MYELIYASAATHPFTAEDLAALLRLARERNHADGVTGLLLYADGSFLQVLEGPRRAVEDIFARVERDQRHCNIRILSRAEPESCSFADWSMGFVDVKRQAAALGFNEFLRTGKLSTNDVVPRLQRVLDGFRDGRWRQLVA